VSRGKECDTYGIRLELEGLGDTEDGVRRGLLDVVPAAHTIRPSQKNDSGFRAPAGGDTEAPPVPRCRACGTGRKRPRWWAGRWRGRAPWRVGKEACVRLYRDIA
jgi:hypothetical protein